ncbi:MAG TPA: hypothetical protein VF331_24020 [Polyangiales bacterium]
MTQSMRWLLSTALALTTACASSAGVHAPRHAPGGFDLRTPFPVAMRSPFGEPYGVPVALGQHGTQDPARLDDYLKPVALANASPANPKLQAVLVARAAVPAQRTQASTPLPAERVAPAPDNVQLAVSDPPTASSDAQRYATRELKSEKQQNFRGGDVLVIGAGTLLLILLVVLLVVLIIR